RAVFAKASAGRIERGEEIIPRRTRRGERPGDGHAAVGNEAPLRVANFVGDRAIVCKSMQIAAANAAFEEERRRTRDEIVQAEEVREAAPCPERRICGVLLNDDAGVAAHVKREHAVDERGAAGRWRLSRERGV